MSEGLIAVLVGLAGVFFGSVCQWLISSRVIRSETERLHRQLSTEFRLQQFSEWQAKFSAVVADLLAATDPECLASHNKANTVQLVLRAQLLLNPSLPSHAKVNDLINKLALTVNGWHGKPDPSAVLDLHGALLDAARNTLYLPGREL
jgi:hypothetical protein